MRQPHAGNMPPVPTPRPSARPTGPGKSALIFILVIVAVALLVGGMMFLAASFFFITWETPDVVVKPIEIVVPDEMDLREDYEVGETYVVYEESLRLYDRCGGGESQIFPAPDYEGRAKILDRRELEGSVWYRVQVFWVDSDEESLIGWIRTEDFEVTGLASWHSHVMIQAWLREHTLHRPEE